jgi:hypothetical protein
MLRWLRIVAFLVLGAIFGPLLIAVFIALTPEPDWPLTVPSLLREYDDRDWRESYSSPRSLDTTERDCGYDLDRLLVDPPGMDGAEATRRNLDPNWEWWSHRSYNAVHSLRRSNYERLLDYFRGEHLIANSSRYETRFLLECMCGTVFAPICERRVHMLLGEWRSKYLAPASARDQFRDPGLRETVCVFLDGVAARQGLPLAKR